MRVQTRHDAVRLGLSSGLLRDRIAWIWISSVTTLKKWIRDAQNFDPVVADTTDYAAFWRVNERFRRENLLLRSERKFLKNDPGRLSVCAA